MTRVSNIARDFTEETRAELDREIRETAAEAHADLKTRLDVVSALPTIGLMKKAVCVVQIQEFCKQIQGIKEEARQQINDVFRDARGSDVKYGVKLGSIAEQLGCYRKTLSDLANLIRPGASGECAFASEDFMANLAKIGAGAVDYWIDQLMLRTCDKGKVTVEPNWDMIEQWLAMDRGELSKTQLDALAAVFLSLESDEDLGKFLSRAYSRSDEQAPPHIPYTLAGAVSDLEERVRVLATAEAMATIWAKDAEEGALYGEVSGRVEKMQALQILCATGKSIAWDQTGDPHPVGIEGFPIRDSLVRFDRSGGVLEFKIAGYLSFYASERFLPEFKTGVVGANGTGLLEASDMGATSRANYIYAQVGELSDAELKVIAKAVISSAVGVIPLPKLGLGLDVYGTYANHVRSVDTAVDFEQFSSMVEDLKRLGALVSYSNCNGQIVVHAIQYDTYEGEDKADSFLEAFNAKDNGGIRITKDELRAIVTGMSLPKEDEGDKTTPEKVPGNNTALDLEQQEYVYKAFREYLYPNGAYYASKK